MATRSTTFATRRTGGTDIHREPAGRIANAVRIGFGLFYLATALFNAVVMFRYPENYLKMVEPAFVPFYKTITARVIAPYAPVWTCLVVLGETALGMLILSKRGARLGLIGGIVWCAVLLPGLGLYGLANIPLIIVQLLLLRKQYDGSPITPKQRR